MSDIYREREPLPRTAKGPHRKPGRRRRSSSRRAFDDTTHRKRRSKNSGFRRLLHLSRKEKNQKWIWRSLLILTVIGLVLLAIWQFFYLDYVARKQAQRSDRYVPVMPGEQSAPE